MAAKNNDPLQTEDNIEYIQLTNVSQVNHNYPDVNTAIFETLKEVGRLKDQMQRSDESHKKLITKLTEEIISLRAEVTQLKTRNLIETDTSLLPCLPFFELALLTDFENKLMLDEKMRAQLKQVVKRVGGADVPTFIRSSFKHIISDELAINLTWRGTPMKPSIQQFTIFSIIKDVCHSNFANATDIQINKIVQQHFLHARDRVLKRQSSN